MTIDILLTTYKKNYDEIIQLVSNLKLTGSIIVGNYSLVESEQEVLTENSFIRIINHNKKGVSNNRNLLLLNSKADIVSFFDDDCSITNSTWKNIVIKEFQKRKEANAIRFDVISNDCERPIKGINKSSRLRFSDVKSFGVWGFFFKREFLLKNNLLFNHLIGPGTEHNFGEDVEFSKRLFSITKNVYSSNSVLIDIIQSESTWFSGTYDKKYFFNMGYSGYFIFKRKSFLINIYHLIKHKKQYNGISLLKQISLTRSGYKQAKKDSKKI